MNQVWTEQEKLFIRENSSILTDKEGAEQLSNIVGRKITIHAWRKQRQKMGITKMPGRGICEVKRQEEHT